MTSKGNFGKDESKKAVDGQEKFDWPNQVFIDHIKHKYLRQGNKILPFRFGPFGQRDNK